MDSRHQRVFPGQHGCCAGPDSRTEHAGMTPDDVACLLALAYPVEPLTVENAFITMREVDHLIEIAVSLQAAAASAEQRGRKRSRTESVPLQTQAARKPRVELLALQMAASHSYITEKPRTALPMAASHSYITEKPRTGAVPHIIKKNGAAS